MVLQSVSFLRGKGGEDVYHSQRFPLLLQQLYQDRDDVRWRRPLSDEEREVVKGAQLASEIFEDLENVEWVPKESSGKKEDGKLDEALKILLDVYMPDVVVGTLACLSRYRESLRWVF